MNQSNKQFLTILGLSALCLALSDPLLGVPVADLKAPLKAMKDEVWSYMYIVKVAASVVGGCFSVMQQSVVPLGVGAGISVGLHFFEKVIGDGSAALLGF